MKVKPFSQQLPVRNHDNLVFDKNVFQKHSDLFKGGCKRGLIVGSSGSGKTNTMISLLVHPNGLRFTDIYIYSKSLQQPKYEYLRNIIKPIKQIGYHEYEASEEIIPPSKAKEHSIIIFDDVVCDSQSVI